MLINFDPSTDKFRIQIEVWNPDIRKLNITLTCGQYHTHDYCFTLCKSHAYLSNIWDLRPSFMAYCSNSGKYNNGVEKNIFLISYLNCFLLNIRIKLHYNKSLSTQIPQLPASNQLQPKYSTHCFRPWHIEHGSVSRQTCCQLPVLDKGDILMTMAEF